MPLKIPPFFLSPFSKHALKVTLLLLSPNKPLEEDTLSTLLAMLWLFFDSSSNLAYFEVTQMGFFGDQLFVIVVDFFCTLMSTKLPTPKACF